CVKRLVVFLGQVLSAVENRRNAYEGPLLKDHSSDFACLSPISTTCIHIKVTANHFPKTVKYHFKLASCYLLTHIT
ncbi:hypothetical protein LDENG_00257150, partial [Lucifuga dentata]